MARTAVQGQRYQCDEEPAAIADRDEAVEILREHAQCGPWPPCRPYLAAHAAVIEHAEDEDYA